MEPNNLPKVDDETRTTQRIAAIEQKLDQCATQALDWISLVTKRLDNLAAKVLEHDKMLAQVGQILFAHRQALLSMKALNDPAKQKIWTPRA